MNQPLGSSFWNSISANREETFLAQSKLTAISPSTSSATIRVAPYWPIRTVLFGPNWENLESSFAWRKTNQGSGTGTSLRESTFSFYQGLKTMFPWLELTHQRRLPAQSQPGQAEGRGLEQADSRESRAELSIQSGACRAPGILTSVRPTAWPPLNGAAS